MNSKISEILDRMNEENAKLRDYKRQYNKLNKARKANHLHINLTWYEEKCGQENIRIDSHEQKHEILNLIEAYYVKQAKECKRKLEEMVEEMKGTNE